MKDWQQHGFLQGDHNLESTLVQLMQWMEAIERLKGAFTEEEWKTRPASGKWSKQEILGHLTDSAINNLKRFTEIQFEPSPYIIRPYNQDELVRVNHYQDLSLNDLFIAWAALNRQIIHVARHIPPEKLALPVNPGYQDGAMKTLEWLIGDYVAHMEHHFRQMSG